jgi:hypothetical protein
MCAKFYLFEPVTAMVLVSLCSADHVIRVHAIWCAVGCEYPSAKDHPLPSLGHLPPLDPVAPGQAALPVEAHAPRRSQPLRRHLARQHAQHRRRRHHQDHRHLHGSRPYHHRDPSPRAAPTPALPSTRPPAAPAPVVAPIARRQRQPRLASLYRSGWGRHRSPYVPSPLPIQIWYGPDVHPPPQSTSASSTG